MNALKAHTAVLSMLTVKTHTEDTVVNVVQDSQEMERTVQVC